MTSILLLCALLIVTAGALAFRRPLLPAVLLLAAYSGFVVILLIVLGAVDVAFTEAVVGTGVSTVVLMVLIGRIDVERKIERGRGWIAGVACVIGLGGALAPAMVALPAFGDPNAVAATHIAPDYIRRSLEDMHTPNVVTAILADYRGFDTLIETTVIMTAAVACVLVLGRRT